MTNNKRNSYENRKEKIASLGYLYNDKSIYITRIHPVHPLRGSILFAQIIFTSIQRLFDINLDVLAIFIIDNIDDLAGHARAHGIHHIGHVHAFHLRGEMGADLQPGIYQRQRDLHGGL